MGGRSFSFFLSVSCFWYAFLAGLVCLASMQAWARLWVDWTWTLFLKALRVSWGLICNCGFFECCFVCCFGCCCFGRKSLVNLLGVA